VVGSGATVSLSYTKLSAGRGGNGSAGGGGGTGANGSLGAAGAMSSCDTACCTGGSLCSQNCGHCNAQPIAGGTTGGPGGRGGNGSLGGAGSGGSSYSIVRLDGARTLFDPANVTLEYGAPGVGAGTASEKAPDGAAGEVLVLPAP
jgi:hypothetical protein